MAEILAEAGPAESNPPRDPAPDVPRTVCVIVNSRAGAVLEIGRERFGAAIREAFRQHGIEAETQCVDGAELSKAIRTAATSAIDVLVLAGGDGTISRALPELLACHKPVAILPLGTLNLLARDLGQTGRLAQDIAVVAQGVRRSIDLAELNGIPFHSSSGLGFFGMMARERETARRRFPFSKALGFVWAATRTIMFSKPVHVEIDIDGKRETHEADAVLVTNNRFIGAPWHRPRLDEGLLEVHMLKAGGLRPRFRAALAVARGTWRDLPSLTTFDTPSVRLLRRDKRRSTVATDGEVRQMVGTLHYTVRPAALSLPAGGREGEPGA